MRILIVGATGHIGTYLVPRLVAAGHEVVGVSRGLRQPYHESPAWQSTRLVVMDRVEAERNGSFGKAMASLEPDVVVDLTCFDLGSATHIVDALRNRVKLFIHCGTLWVHGVPQSRPYDETAPRKPFGEYGIRKAQIERFLLDEARAGFPASVLHPGHITGRGWPPINPAGNLDVTVFERLARGDKVALPEDGMATLQHVHADDVAQAFERAIERPEAAIGESFHVAASEPITLCSYARGVASWFGREADLEFLPWDEWRATVTEKDAALTRDHVMHSPWASIAKAKERLGFEPRCSALAAVRDAVDSMTEGADDTRTGDLSSRTDHHLPRGHSLGSGP